MSDGVEGEPFGKHFMEGFTLPTPVMETQFRSLSLQHQLDTR